MVEIKVWAPRAREARLQLAAAEIAMKAVGRGWWSAEVAGPHPVEYAFLLDGGPPLPDPRSPWQPFGVHGASRTVDHDAFKWTDARWQAPPLAGAVIYELHIGTFTREGTFDAAIRRLPYLAGLGVTHVELMPVAEFPGEWGWGYDGVDLYAPHHHYGGPEGLKRLVNALHEHGLAAVLDVVYNHLGPSGNYLNQFGPYYNSRFETPWGEALNLCGAGAEEVRGFLTDNAVMWLRDYHFDALRLDAVHALIDEGAVHFLEELASRVECLEAELGRHLDLIAEADLNDPRMIRPREVGGYGLSAQWSDDFHHALHALLTGERGGYYADFGSMRDLAKALEEGFVFDGCYSEFRGRNHGRPLERPLRSKLVGCLQNHDQVGNRAAGERIAALVSPGRAKIGAAVALTSPFIPLLFQGEEWGASAPFQYFTNHTDPDLGRAVSEGRRREFVRFGWDPESIPDPQARETFLRSKLDWDECHAPGHAELLDWYRSLIALRRSVPDLKTGDVAVEYSEDDGWFSLRRGRVTVLFNLGGVTRRAPRPSGQELLIVSSEGVDPLAGAPASLRLPPDSAAILADPVAPGVHRFLRGRRTAAAPAPGRAL